MSYECSWLPEVLLASALMLSGCSTPQPIEGVVRPNSGEPPLEFLPGPMPGFGSFDTYSDALLAACSLILSKPNANAGRVGEQDFPLRWRISSEYCAWLYYTPERKYEMSMLTDQHNLDDLEGKRSCLLPSYVKDPRYPPESLKYIFALHNHPHGSTISRDDIRLIVAKGAKHGFGSSTKDGVLQLSIVAFFSNKATEPSCDGFHQYIPAAHQIRKWSKTAGQWHCEQTGIVDWHTDGVGFSIKETSASCLDKDVP
ncbi:hypothetical protein [Archangium lansingense]|uniref:Lipoprotein n=1 Tax=Archangium lansingense TaxID=2995310 RepID=A0ABT4A1P9_9BACT|nr:hypothetical protein [Archangium lansinium]MCY1075560.1 hypothetical protein [Archangium lansinium]